MSKNRGWASVLFLLISFAASMAQSKQQAQGSHEIHQLFLEDQKDREVIDNSAQMPSWQDWEKIATREKQRQERARELTAGGALNSGEDYRDAAFIFRTARRQTTIC